MRLLLKALFILSITTSFAMADLELGVYEGLYGEEKCLLDIKSVSFVQDIKHPLNERVSASVSFSVSDFTLSHLPKINEEDHSIQAEKNLLTGALGSGEGAEALKLKMIHTDTFKGPVSFIYYSENYVSGDKIKKECVKLTKL
ncbi:MAG: hypothetical protein ACI9QD_000357 [Thermoproteota archaeon]|jgi:hypothetical protein